MAHVQSNKGYANAASVQVAYLSNVAAGSLLVCFVHAYSSGPHATTPISDTRGNTWSRIGDKTNGGDGSLWLDGFYAISNGAGACTVTFTAQGSAYISVTIGEYSGIDASGTLNAQNKATGSNDTPSVTVSSTTASATVLGWMTSMAGGQVAITEGNGYTIRQEYEDGSAEMHAAFEDKSESTTGSKTANFSLGSSQGWICGIAIFKNSAAATPSAPPPNPARRLMHRLVR